MDRRRAPAALLAFASAVLIAGALTGCGGVAAGAAAGNTVRVVAAENFWGSIARQIGGGRVTVRSIIVNPAQDPHSYEPTSNDARAMATAQLAIVNAVGYDPWAPKLLAANPVSDRQVLTVGSLFGLQEGDNPHRWYDPPEVESVAGAIARALIRLDPKHAAYYTQRLGAFESRGLAGYHALIARIRQRYGGVPVGASESIFALLAPALGLRLVTPASFMKAISEGNDVTAGDTAAAQRQITDHQIKVWVYNSQNVTPEIQRLTSLARAQHIPVATVTETLSPPTASFEQWQVRQLQGIEAALHQATGR
ncbi:MAG TPA: zinc ABC transporter substrate-binding protein [Solirubrobacteraceae bacterium]